MGPSSRLGTSLALALACALSACQAPGQGGVPATKRRPVGVQSPAPAVGVPPGQVGTTAPPLVGPGGTLVSDAGGALVTLEGVVRAPAGIIANNGGAIIANNGGGLITDNGAGVVANNGAGYRLRAAVEQAPFAGVRVEIQDAGGQPVPDGKGGVVTAVTGPDGSFKITAPLPARNLVAVVQLVEGQGALRAIVGRGARRADVELVSTLTTGYILGAYVRGQADPLATLERLPVAVEAATRAKAAAALAAGRAAPPATVTDQAVTTTVDALRRGDRAFDAQMEDVKRLLIAAGQSDLGEGQPATKVLLTSLHGVLPMPDGGFYLPAWSDRRLWRVKPDGTLTRVAGLGGAISPDADGAVARDAGLGDIQAATVDGQGRLVFADTDGTCRLWRVETDGRLKRLADLGSTLVFTLACGPDGTVWSLAVRQGIMAADEALTTDAEAGGWDLLAIDPAGAVRTAWPGVRFDHLNGLGAGDPMYVGPKGEIYMRGQDADQGLAVVKLDPVARTEEPVPPPPGTKPVAFDRTGAWYWRDEAGALRMRGADGQARTFLASPPPALEDFSLLVEPVGGGVTYLSDQQLVYRVEGGVATLVAGLPAADAGVGGTETSLDPAGFVVLPDGTLIVAESARKRLVAVDAAGRSTVYLGPDAGLAGPTDVARDGAGRLYVADGRLVKEVRADKTVRTAFTHPYGQAYVFDVLAAPDGTLYVAADETNYDVADPTQADADGMPLPTRVVWSLWRVPPAGEPERLVALKEGDVGGDYTGYELLLDAAGNLHRVNRLAAGAQLQLEAWDGGAWKAVGKPWAGPGEFDYVSDPALDAAGRVYYGLATSVVRGDPATGARVVIAGPGGRVFLGAGVDESVASPQHLAFDAAGDLLFNDAAHRQIKRVPKAKLE